MKKKKKCPALPFARTDLPTPKGNNAVIQDTRIRKLKKKSTRKEEHAILER